MANHRRSTQELDVFLNHLRSDTSSSPARAKRKPRKSEVAKRPSKRQSSDPAVRSARGPGGNEATPAEEGLGAAAVVLEPTAAATVDQEAAGPRAGEPTEQAQSSQPHEQAMYPTGSEPAPEEPPGAGGQEAPQDLHVAAAITIDIREEADKAAAVEARRTDVREDADRAAAVEACRTISSHSAITPAPQQLGSPAHGSHTEDGEVEWPQRLSLLRMRRDSFEGSPELEWKSLTKSASCIIISVCLVAVPLYLSAAQPTLPQGDWISMACVCALSGILCTVAIKRWPQEEDKSREVVECS